MEYLEIDDFLIKAGRFPMIDVRSPGEYEKGHISGAINVPLFSDEERALVGTIYARDGQQKAISCGLQIVSPKLENFKALACRIAEKKHLLVHCWRGGMRSEKMALLFEKTGLKCNVLRGGYKAYRAKLRNDFSIIDNLFVLEGPTGSGKTEILNHMKQKGAQVIDLEMLARHRGSTFGWIGQEPQPTTAQFQNNIHNRLMQMKNDEPVWIEGESLKIGKVTLPETLWESMNNGTIINILLDRDIRRKRIVEEYGKHPRAQLVSSLDKIQSALGNKNYRHVSSLIMDGDLNNAVDVLLQYYDKSYQFSLKKYRRKNPINISLNHRDSKINAGVIMQKLSNAVI